MLRTNFYAIISLVIIMSKKKLYRIEKGKRVCGVCGGIAEYFNIDPTIIRVLWAIFTFAYGTGILAYFVCALCMPSENDIQ